MKEYCAVIAIHWFKGYKPSCVIFKGEFPDGLVMEAVDQEWLKRVVDNSAPKAID